MKDGVFLEKSLVLDPVAVKGSKIKKPESVVEREDKNFRCPYISC